MEYETLRTHPRFLELRFMVVYDDLLRAFGIEEATLLIEALCNSFHINYTLISGVISKRREILELRHANLVRYRQELLIMGLSRGYSKTDVATKIMKIARQTFYSYGDELDPEHFCTDDWVRELDYNTVSLGVKAYANEVYRLLQIIDALKGMI